MINVPMKTSEPLNKNTISSLNQKKVETAHTRQSIGNINNRSTSLNTTNNTNNNPTSNGTISNVRTNTTTSSTGYGRMNSNIRTNTSSCAQQTAQHAPAIISKPIPPLRKPTRKGQKVALEGVGRQSKLKVCLGWNVNNSQCDVDVSAFLLGGSGKVIGDEWFVFYGQTKSPDNSVCFYEDNGADREYITIDFSRLNQNVTKIVFVLTINEAFEKRLNFSMLKDAYIRILDGATLSEYISFKMTDYYTNVSSMMIGEIYLHNNNWKFNAIGNGVAKDLAGLCDLYGVQTI